MKKARSKKTVIKETTTNELAVMVAKGFSSMDRKFEAIDKKFEAIDSRFDEIDSRFDEIDRRFERLETIVFKIDTKVNDIDKRLKKVEEAIETLLLGYSIARNEIKELNARIFRLEKKVGIDK